MKINEKHLKELRNCELYQHMLPRYQRNIEWIIKEYIHLTEEENIKVKTYFVTPLADGAIKTHSPIEEEINQRRLLNLNVLDFDFGLCFTSNAFMPFIGEKEIGLFEATNYIDEIEDGDICLLADKIEDKLWLTTKEKTGFFTLDCEFLDDGEALVLLGKLVNIETR